MGKRYYKLWPQVVSFDNLCLAFKKAAKGKRSKPSVAAFEFELETNLLQLQVELREGSYRPGGYVSFHIHDPKRRLISAASFRDRVVHHALVNRVLNLCAQIIASGEGVLQDEYDVVFFSGDDLFAIGRPRGLPIGNLTSQFWANVYLNGLDHFVKRQLKCRGYVRYVDDILLFADSKAELHAWRAEVIAYLATLRLTVHENRAQPRPCATGVPFLGFQVFPDHRRLKRRKGVYARRRLKALARQYRQGEIELEQVQASVQGWINHVRYGDTWGLRLAILHDLRLSKPGVPDDWQAIADLQQDL